MSTSPDRWLRIDNPIMWAVFATALFGSLLLFLGSVPTCNNDLFQAGECPPKWRHIVAAPINEVGDTLAGLAGVLAFIWLVATVLLQAHELGEQRKEFQEQRKATQDMARAMEAQATIFEDERRSREENRARDLLEERLNGIAFRLREPNRIVIDFVAYRDGRQLTDMRAKIGGFNNESPVPEIMGALYRHLTSQLKIMRANSKGGVEYRAVELREAHLGEVLGLTADILKETDDLSDADKQRVWNLRISAIREIIEAILQFPERRGERQ